jgi:hypothetical protein
MQPGGIKHYGNKMRSLAMMQSEHDNIKGYTVKCGLSGKEIKPLEYCGVWYDAHLGMVAGKLDFCHIMSRTHHNVKNYQYFIDSLLNGVMGLHERHLSSNECNYPYTITERQAFVYNAFLDTENNKEFKGAPITLRRHINEILNAHRINDLHTIENAIKVIKAYTEEEYD